MSETESNHPLNVFFCYAYEDVHWYQQLDSHLSILQRQNLIILSDETHILAEREPREERLRLFHHAEIILRLISPSFFKSYYQAMEDALALIERVYPI